MGPEFLTEPKDNCRCREREPYDEDFRGSVPATDEISLTVLCSEVSCCNVKMKRSISISEIQGKTNNLSVCIAFL